MESLYKSFDNNDDEGFKAVHSKDTIRVMQDNNGIIGYDEYFKSVPDSLNLNGQTGKKILSCVLFSALPQMERLLKWAIIKHQVLI